MLAIPGLGAGGDTGALAGPLAARLVAGGYRVAGLAGPPGCGKTTLMAAVAAAAGRQDRDGRPLAVSLDDVYLSRAERDARGIRFRAQPGSHDLGAACALIDAVRGGAPALTVPRFDHGTDDRRPPETVAGPVARLLLEGLFVGLEAYGSEAVAGRLDVLIYLDCPTALARQRRLGREARLREASGGTHGLSEAEMETFWREVLEPGIARWVRPIRTHADLVVTLDDAGGVARVDARAGGRWR
jgi:uridine kinase